jgi:hypothetical protein
LATDVGEVLLPPVNYHGPWEHAGALGYHCEFS